MLILDHSSGSFCLQPGGPMVLPCVKGVHYDKVSVVESKATYLTAAGRQTKGPRVQCPLKGVPLPPTGTFYKGSMTPQEHH